MSVQTGRSDFLFHLNDLKWLSEHMKLNLACHAHLLGECDIFQCVVKCLFKAVKMTDEEKSR